MAHQNTDMRQTIDQLHQRVETMEIMLHEAQEQRVTGLGPLMATQQQEQRSYAGAVLHGATMTGNPIRFLAPRADEFFCTIDFSGTEGGEKAVNIPELKEKIEKEAQKGENKTFKCRGIVKDHRTQCRVRILCRSEEELDIVKKAATEVATEGAKTLRDQLYPLKVNNARTDAVLQPNGDIKGDIVSALDDSNKTQVSKVSWLSSRHARKAHGSMVVFLKKRSEAERLLNEGFITVDGESASVRVFKPNLGPPRCYNCQSAGHKAFSCKEAQKCGNCAQVGHGWNDCKASESKCAVCSGPHAVTSRSCRPQHGFQTISNTSDQRTKEDRGNAQCNER